MRFVPSLSWRCLRSVSRASTTRANTQALLGRASLSPSSSHPTPSASRPTTAVASGRPLRVCVVGSGPAGFYVTKYLLKVRQRGKRKYQYLHEWRSLRSVDANTSEFFNLDDLLLPVPRTKCVVCWLAVRLLLHEVKLNQADSTFRAQKKCEG